MSNRILVTSRLGVKFKVRQINSLVINERPEMQVHGIAVYKGCTRERYIQETIYVLDYS